MDKTKERLTHLLKQAQAEYSKEHLVIPVPGFLSKKFIAYCSMKEDLELILEYINILKTKPDRLIKSALSYSMISLYGKCFSDASKNSYPKLESEILLKGDKENQEMHNSLIDLRHQFIAHRGKTESEIGISYLAIPKKNPLEKSQLRFSQLKQSSFSDKDLNKIEGLIKTLVEKLKEKIQKSGQKVHDGMFKLFTTEQLGMMIINNMK